ncbi:unnamed protein product [Linum trigynum]|uniref:C2H2-type domain-containing protein n=1 Tax=Linum trigynum TaxID=586398 RepID=A0AAV2CJQ8_9ROSI
MSSPVDSLRYCPKFYTKRTRLKKITTISKKGATNRILHQSKLELTDDHFCIAFDDNRRQTSRSCKRDCIPGCKEFCKIMIRDTIMLSTHGKKHMPIRAADNQARRGANTLESNIKVNLQKVLRRAIPKKRSSRGRSTRKGRRVRLGRENLADLERELAG